VNSTRRVCLGIITGARGIRGEVRIRTFTERPEDIAKYGPLTDETGVLKFKLSEPKPVKDSVAAHIEGIADRSGAEDLKGTHLYVDRGSLPELDPEEFYHADLVGMRVTSEDGEKIGTVAAVHNFGAGDVLEIDQGQEASFFTPFTRDSVPLLDVENGSLILIVPPGLLDANVEDPN